MNDQVEDLVKAIGVMAEMSLLFFRSLIAAGATVEEASKLVQAYIAATMFGKDADQKRQTGPSNKKPKNPQ